MKYKNKITDDVEDARNIVQVVGRAIRDGKIDKDSALDNLARAMEKLNTALDFLRRE
jgi:hypothetical protein